MFSRLLLPVVTLAMLAVGAPAWAQLPCASAVGDCVLSSSATVPTGTYDIRPRNLVLQNRTITVSGAGLFKVLAANVTIEPGGRFIATGTDGNTQIHLDATGTLALQSQGTSKSRIDVSGNFGGGTITLHAVGDVSVIGTLIANASNLLGFGGPINLISDTGNITVGGDPSEGLRSFGNAQGSGGSISMFAPLGSISIATQLVPKGGDCSSCEVDLNAGLDITSTAQGVMDLRASGLGDGGFFTANAGGNINLAGNILANGSSDDFDGGTGGDVLVSATGSITISGRIEVNGAGQDAAPGSETGSVDGDGGSSDISAGTFIQMTGPMFGVSKGFGQSDEFSFDAGTNITIGAEIDVSGDNFAGDVALFAEGAITVGARIRTSTAIDPVNKPASLGGSIDLEGCQVTVNALGDVISTGPGGNPSGAIFIGASTGTTIAGKLTATAINELTWRTSAPVITGMVVPTASLVQSSSLPCCGVMCPTTTTSTSTTSTTSTSSSTSTSAAPSTTTSTSTSQAPTTLPPTTTVVSTTLMTTTSTVASTTVPTTSATTTSAPSTTLATSTTTSSTTTQAPSTTSSSSTSLASTTTSLGASTTTSTSLASTSTTTGAVTTTTPTTTTVAPTTSSSSSTTIVVATTSSTSTDTLPPTTTTTLPLTCFDTAVGIEAVRCRLDAIAELVGQASETDLGGRKIARKLAARLAKATSLSSDPVKAKRLKKAARQVRAFSNQVARGMDAGKVNATLGTELLDLAAEAATELAGVVAGG